MQPRRDFEEEGEMVFHWRGRVSLLELGIGMRSSGIGNWD
jgi:hypothetical protein